MRTTAQDSPTVQSELAEIGVWYGADGSEWRASKPENPAVLAGMALATREAKPAVGAQPLEVIFADVRAVLQHMKRAAPPRHRRRTWKQRDVTRALRAAEKAGVTARVEIAPNGTLSLVPEPRLPNGVGDDDDILARLT